MADTPTLEFLRQLKDAYPTSPTRLLPSSYSQLANADFVNPWFIIAAVAYSASNCPKAVPVVYKYIIEDLEKEGATLEKKKHITTALRDAIYKAGLISGYSRAISALIELYSVTPEELRETKLIRTVDNENVSDIMARGQQLFEAMYGNTGNTVQPLLEAIHPDMGWFSKNIAYGLTYNATHIVSQRDTSYAIVAALIAMDTPRQIAWHLSNCRRGGASTEEVDAVRSIAMNVSRSCGVVWVNGVPELLDD